ncbi:MAG TPA: DUF1175 family protein [Candidatus Eisenbacteria bacterium]|nr:DUF1175 family protein [Candidatus Eisenbacteria bacterium]
MGGWVLRPFAGAAKGWGKRWLVVLAVAAIVAVLGAFRVHRAFAPAVLLVDSAPSALPADGFSSIEFKLHSSTGRDLRGLQVTVDEPHRVAVDSVVVRGESAVVSLRIGVLPGKTKLQFVAPGFDPRQLTLYTTLDVSDSVGDGTPDFLRLHDAADRGAFRRWFTLLAEAEYYRGGTPGEIEDCAALLRYAYREALRQHDSVWAKAATLPTAPWAGEIRQYQYPYTRLGAGLFRIREGSFTADDLKNGAFAQFADAKTLWHYNSYSVARDISRALPGDLLFFRQEGQQHPFHAMIFVGPSQFESGHEPLVVYHTGAIGKSPGEIRRPTLTQLMTFPDPRWRPVASNPSFLGVYRWNILRGAE